MSFNLISSQEITPLTWANFCSKFSLEPLSKELTTCHKIVAVTFLIFLNLISCFVFSTYTYLKRVKSERAFSQVASSPLSILLSESPAGTSLLLTESQRSGDLTNALAASGFGSFPEEKTDPEDFFARMSGVLLEFKGVYIDDVDHESIYQASQMCRDDESKSNIMEQIYQSLNLNNCEIKKEIEQMSEIISPQVSLLKRVAEYYKQKYGIDIQVVLYSDLERVLGEISGKNGNFGIVVLMSNQFIGHVVPLLINSDCRKKQVIKLDVLSEEDCRLKEISQIIMDILDAKGFEIFVTRDGRQVDLYSCRTESLGILRNMLLYLKERGIRDFRGLNFLREAKFVFEPDLIFRLEYSHVRPRREISYQEMLLPGECDYIDQIRRRDLDLRAIFCIRTKYSKRALKREREESVADFRKRYQLEVESKTEYTLRKGVAFREDIAEGVIVEHTSSDGKVRTIVSRTNQTAVITILRKIAICAHQHLKGYRNVLKHVGNFVEVPPFLHSVSSFR